MIGIFSVLACVAGAWKYSGHKKKQPAKKRACYAGYFSVGIFFARYFPARIFFPRNQSAGHIFSEITHTSLKVRNGRPLSLFKQVVDSLVNLGEPQLVWSWVLLVMLPHSGPL